MAKKTKKPRIAYKEDKAAELEAFLFGAGRPDVFDRHEEEGCDLGGEGGAAVKVGDVERGAGTEDACPLVFFEDRRGRPDALSNLDSEDEEAEDQESEDEQSEEGAGAPSSSAESLDEEGNLGGDRRGASDAGTSSTSGPDSSEDEEAMLVRRRRAAASAAAAAAVAAAQGGDAVAASKKAKRKSSGKTEGGTEPRRKAKGKAGVVRPAWVDPQEAEVVVDVAGGSRLRKLRSSEEDTVMAGGQYVSSLRQHHASMNPRTSWAQLGKPSAGGTAGGRRRDTGYGADSEEEEEEGGRRDAEGDEEDGDALLRHAGGLMTAPSKGGRLPEGTINVTPLRDANHHDAGDAVVRALDWHPNGQLMLTGGLDKKIRVFQVDGVRNPRVQSMFLENCPISSAAFAMAGSQILASGRRPYFYLANLATGQVERVVQSGTSAQQKSLETFTVSPSPDNPMVAFLGDQGYVPLISLRSRQWVGHVKMNGTARAAAFAPGDENLLLTSGGDGVVHTWDLRMRRCVHTLIDEGNVGNTSGLAMSAGNRYIATGSGSGVVNVYRGEDVLPGGTAGGGTGLRSATPPLKALMNLTTSVDTLAFNADAQILAVASRMRKDALRLVHLPSLTVFSNWPTFQSPLGHVHCAAFSPGGGLLAIGNAKGRALLYRLNHYPVA